MRKALALLALLVVVIGSGVWLYLTPQLTLASMRDAAARKNAGELASYVDFPSVRASLKVALGSKVKDISKDLDNPMLAGLAAMAGAFVDPLVENLVTPDSMALMLSGVPPTMLATNQDTSSTTSTSTMETESHYDGLNDYIVTVKRSNSAWPPVQLELKRDGIASWKLTAVRLL